MLAGMLIGHQGGWDEVLTVAVPIAIFVFLVWLAGRRAQNQVDRARQGSPDDSETQG